VTFRRVAYSLNDLSAYEEDNEPMKTRK